MRDWWREHVDDACYLAGAVLGGVGVYRLWPDGVWFYGAVWCLVLGGLFTLANHRGTRE